MRTSIFYALLALFLAVGPAAAQDDDTLVSESFDNEELVQVLNKVAGSMGGTTVYGPGVTGTVTIKLEKVPAEEAVRRVLATQRNTFEYRILKTPGPVLVVAKKGELDKVCQDFQARVTVRMEYLLEHAPAAKVIQFLRGEYPLVSFLPHPTMNGFYAKGTKEELLQIKRELSNLDKVPGTPPPPVKAVIPVKYGDLVEIKGLLEKLVPGVTYSVDARNGLLTVEGSPDQVDQVREMLTELDMPIEPTPSQGNRSGLTASTGDYVATSLDTSRPQSTVRLAKLSEVLPNSTPPAESYQKLEETKFREVTREPLSTFSIDVDTASYANVRRFLNEGALPPAGAVRIEEMINYFTYCYPQPQGKVPFSVSTELTQCPWNARHQLLRIGLQGRNPKKNETPPRNLVFLIDVSGSMDAPNKLPLVKRSLQLLLTTLGKEDRVAIVVYAGSEGLYLPATTCEQKDLISEKIEQLGAAGSTNGAAGIQLAYDVARENFRQNAVNRVILCTDGDFNVGLTGGSLMSLIEKEREDGIFLSVLGFGTGNIKDDTMEGLADKGNGNYAYIDGLMEAEKVLVKESGSTLETIAKDVKLQLEFNPKRVHSYRLIGYENRRLQNEDFDDDKKDAGEMGAGHNVTALYELAFDDDTDSKALRYQKTPRTTALAESDELAMIKLRYKEPNEKVSRLFEVPITEQASAFEKAGEDLRFAVSVAAFGLILSDSQFTGSANLHDVARWASEAAGRDPEGYRHEFVRLVGLAEKLQNLAKSE